MTLPFVDRPPMLAEVEMLRLILSTYQDGSGMLITGNGSLPGWRDFERAVAAAFSGKALESKWIYDVLLQESGSRYGISCKMRETLSTTLKSGRVTMELSNASGAFWDVIKTKGLTQENYHTQADVVGATLLDVVESWYADTAIDNQKSFYLVLQWDRKKGLYQLFQFSLNLPDPQELIWQVTGRRLIGRDSTGILFEWYGFSGGQLKYYPRIESALWHSPVFSLEPLPNNLESGLLYKAASYFPLQWRKTQA